MKKIIPVLNILLASLVIYLKNIYGKLHWAYAKLLEFSDINELKKTGISIAIHELSLIIIIFATITLIMGFICFKERMPNRSIGLLILFVSILSILYSLIIM